MPGLRLGFQMARFESIEKKRALAHYAGRVVEANADPEIEYEIQGPEGNGIDISEKG